MVGMAGDSATARATEALVVAEPARPGWHRGVDAVDLPARMRPAAAAAAFEIDEGPAAVDQHGGREARQSSRIGRATARPWTARSCKVLLACGSVPLLHQADGSLTPCAAANLQQAFRLNGTDNPVNRENAIYPLASTRVPFPVWKRTIGTPRVTSGIAPRSIH